jgi:hypothetical protein
VGEKRNHPFQLSFNASLKVDFQGSRVTSDGGLVLVWEWDERLGLSELIAQRLTDSRGKNTQLPLADLLRQSVYSRLAGYEDVNDLECLSQDPCGSPKFKTGEKLGSCPTVDNFVAAKAPSFNRVQQTSTSRLQTIQQESLRINKNP